MQHRFRWVFCQLEVLRQCFPPSVRYILEELPESLDETYERILREIRRPNQGHARRLLQCLVAAARPLRVEELAEVLAFDFSAEGVPKLNPGWRLEDQEEAVMSACSSLVIIVKDGDSRIVQFSHFSVQEFLTSDRLGRSSNEDISRYHVPLEAAHTILAQSCLGVLLKLDDSVDRDKTEIFPLAEYAAEYWDTHALFKGVSSRLMDWIECLFDVDKPHFAAWFSIQGPRWASGDPPDFPKFTATPLYYASYFGLYSLVEHLITKRPEDITAIGGFNGTPLHAAAIRGHIEVVLLLLKHVPVDIRSTWLNRTPLHCIALEGQVEIGRHLLKHGADVNARQESGWTPLHLVACFGHLESMRLLLDHGANPHACNDDSRTPYQMANSQRRQEILQLLSEYGFKPEEE
jgi:Ankyrin repeats (3 copies)/Ankyrin repeat